MDIHKSKIEQLIERYCDPNRVPTQEELDFMKSHEERMRPYLPVLRSFEAALTQCPVRQDVIAILRATEPKPLLSSELMEEIERANRFASLRRRNRLR